MLTKHCIRNFTQTLPRSRSTKVEMGDRECTVTLQPLDKAKELGPVKNHQGRTEITNQHYGPCHIMGRLRGVHYGHYKGKSAVVMLFQFKLITDIRYTSA